MVFDAAHYDGRAVEPIEDTADVAMHFFAEGAVTQLRSALLGGEDDVQENLGKRLRHEPTLEPRAK